MRHGDYKTTLKHYTVLGLNDTAAAIQQLPTIEEPGTQTVQATGIDDVETDTKRRAATLQVAGARFGASTCDDVRRKNQRMLTCPIRNLL